MKPAIVPRNLAFEFKDRVQRRAQLFQAACHVALVYIILITSKFHRIQDMCPGIHARDMPYGLDIELCEILNQLLHCSKTVVNAV